MKKMRGRRGGRVRDDDDDGGEGGADTASLGKFGFGVYLASGRRETFLKVSSLRVRQESKISFVYCHLC